MSPESLLEVHAGKSGLLSGLGHEHRVRAHAFSGTVVYFPEDPGRSRVSLTVLTDSLRVVPEADLAKTVNEFLARIGEFSGPVLEMTKKVIGSSLGLPLVEAMKKSQDIYLNQLMALEDVQEGLRAVLEKRKPVWKNK